LASTTRPTTWRRTGPYVPTNSSKAGLLVETREFLRVLAQTRDVESTARQLRDGGLPQRAWETRRTIVDFIRRRLTSWQPPDWALQDFIAFAQDSASDALKAALLLHACRQDTLLYDLVQQLILPRWHRGEVEVRPADVQQFLDHAEPTHPEVSSWSHETRDRLASGNLSILRDFGLLQGRTDKHIVAPLVPAPVIQHLVRLLRAEGLTDQEVPHHPDWGLWMWEPDHVRRALAALGTEEVPWTT